MQITTDLVPPLPRYTGDAWDWVTQVTRDGWWIVISSWGGEGGDLGAFPRVAVAHFDGRSVFAVAQVAHGDVHVTAFDNRVERDAATADVTLFRVASVRTRVQGAPPTVNELAEPYHVGVTCRR